MTEWGSQYWNGRISRRSLIRGGALAGVGLAGAALIGCGEDEEGGSGGSSGSGGSGGGGGTAAAPGSNPTTAAELTPKSGGVMRIGVPNGPESDTLDTNTTGGSTTPHMALQLYDSLTAEDKENNIYAHLLESWEWAPDYLSVVFKLRQDIEMHDGEHATAENIKFMFDRIKDPSNSRSPAVAALGPQYENTEVVDEYTAKITLNAINHIMMRRIHRSHFGLPSIKSAGGQVSLENNPATDKLKREPIGAGPFTLTEWIQNTKITMKNFPKHNWSPAHINHTGPAYLDTLEWLDIPDHDARFSALLANDIDFIDKPAAVHVGQLRENPDLKTFEGLRKGATYSMYFNNRLSPTDDLRVRQAMNHAVDQDEINKLVLFDVHIPAKGGLIGPSMAGYAEDLEGFYPFDLEKANQLLDAAGWVAGSDGIREKDGEKLTMRWITTAEDIGILVQTQVKKIGVNIEIVKLPAGTAYNDRLAAADDHIIEGSFTNEDPDFIRRQWHTQYLDKDSVSPITDFRGYVNPQADELLIKQTQVPDGSEERNAVWKEVQTIMVEDAVAVPIYYWRTVFGTSKAVENIEVGPVNAYARFEGAWLNA